jgi:hypothetical protein
MDIVLYSVSGVCGKGVVLWLHRKPLYVSVMLCSKIIYGYIEPCSRCVVVLCSKTCARVDTFLDKVM